jgi:hypothetical protein
MIKVYQVIAYQYNDFGPENFSIWATKTTREKAEEVIEKVPPDYMSTVYLTIFEVWTNSKPKAEWE